MKNLLLLLLLSLSLFGMDGEEVYKKKCSSCHQLYIPVEILMKNFMEQNNTLLHLKAPTVNQLSYRLKQRIGDPKGDKDIQLMEVTAFIKNYLLHPDKQKSICLPEIVSYFNTMPSFKGRISDEEIEAVAEWIYFYLPPVKEVNKLQFVDYQKAFSLAKRLGKIIMIEVTSPTCHYCIKMEETTLKDPDVIALISSDFIPVRVDVSRQKLPNNLKWSMTPTFIFLNSDGSVLKTVPGAWMKDDFLTILKEVKHSEGDDR